MNFTHYFNKVQYLFIWFLGHVKILSSQLGNRGSGKADHTSQNVNSDLQPSFPTMQCCRRFYWKEVVLKAQTFNWCCKSGITLLANHLLIGYRDWSTEGISHLVMKNWVKRSWLGTAQAPGAEPTIVMLNCHIVKLTSITLMPID